MILSHGAITHVGIALTFGLIVMAMIYALGDVSGAHLNPAVTLGFWTAGRLPGKAVLPYFSAQSLGALAASGLMKFLFPLDATLGATHPAGAAMQSFILEVVLTMMLMLVILSVSTGPKEKGLMAGIAVGGVIAFESLFAINLRSIDGPRRSLAPALVSRHCRICGFTSRLRRWVR